MRVATHEFTVQTSGRGFFEITKHACQFLDESAIQAGGLTLHCRHTSASLIIQENADPDVRVDFESFFERLVPDGAAYFRHTLEGEDDMAAHIRTALTASNLTIPVIGGALSLGTWQGIYLWEHRYRPHQRRIAMCVMGC